MKKLIYIFLLLLSMSSLMSAQTDKRTKEERIKAVKVAFITEELELTATEAQYFWPLYNEMDAKMKNIRKKRKKNQKGTLDGLSDSEIADRIENMLQADEEKNTLKRVYVTKFKKILNLKKVAKLMGVEQKFKKQMLQRIKEERGNIRNKR